MVLDRPEIPLHTNGSENDIRCQVTKRKISGGTRSDAGRDCRDAFLGLAKTCAKLGIAFWDYLGAGRGGTSSRYLVCQRGAPRLRNRHSSDDDWPHGSRSSCWSRSSPTAALVTVSCSLSSVNWALATSSDCAATSTSPMPRARRGRSLNGSARLANVQRRGFSHDLRLDPGGKTERSRPALVYPRGVPELCPHGRLALLQSHDHCTRWQGRQLARSARRAR